MAILLASFAGKGSELRKACFLDVMREDKLEAIDDFRGGKVDIEFADSCGRLET